MGWLVGRPVAGRHGWFRFRQQNAHTRFITARLCQVCCSSSTAMTVPCCTASFVAAVWASGIVQTVVYIDFFYYYIKSWRNNEKLSLPA